MNKRVKVLCDDLKSEDEGVRRDAIKALTAAATKEALPALIAALESAKVRNERWIYGVEVPYLFEAIGACGRADDRAIDALCANLVVSGYPQVANAAFEALGAMGAQASRACGALEKLLAKDSQYHQAHARITLAAITADLDTHLPPLIDFLDAKDLSARAAAEIALNELGASARPYVEEAAQSHRRARVRAKAAEVLRTLPAAKTTKATTKKTTKTKTTKTAPATPHFAPPALYQRMRDDGVLTYGANRTEWKRTWRQRAIENPPALLLCSGRVEWDPPSEATGAAAPADWDPKHQLVPFARDGAGDPWCWCGRLAARGKLPIVSVAEDELTAAPFAPDLEGFLHRHMLEGLSEVAGHGFTAAEVHKSAQANVRVLRPYLRAAWYRKLETLVKSPPRVVYDDTYAFLTRAAARTEIKKLGFPSRRFSVA